MKRVLLMGCGAIATARHLPALCALRDEGLIHVAVTDVDPARAAKAGKTFDVPVVGSWGEAGDHDALSICAPPGPNAQLAVEALARGLHVVCEKPPGRDPEQAASMAAAAADHPDLVTMVAFNRRSMPLYRRAAELAATLGPATSFIGRFTRDAMGSDPSNTASDWVTSDGSHALDLAVATVGFPVEVTVDRHSVGAALANVWSIQLHTASATASVVLHFAAGRRVERYEWAGPGYDVAFDAPTSLEWAQAGRDVQRIAAKEVAAGDDPASVWGFVDEYRLFLDAIEGTGLRPANDFAYGEDFMNLVHAILTAPSGTTVAVSRHTVAPRVERERSSPPAGAAGGEDARPARPVVLLHQPPGGGTRFLGEEGLLTLQRRCEVRTVASLKGLPEDMGDANVVITGRGAPGLPSSYLDAAPNLGLVVVLGASVAGVHPAEALARGVTITNTADPVASLVAEHGLMLALAGLRHLVASDRAMRAGSWPRPTGRRQQSKARPPRTLINAKARTAARRLGLPSSVKTAVKRAERLAARQLAKTTEALASVRSRFDRKPDLAPPQLGSELSGQSVGLIGWGHTARHLARLLEPFDCQILVCSESAPDHELEAAGARRAALGEVLSGCRVVSLHRGLTPTTQGFLGEAQLAQLRPGTVLVNVARAGLVDEGALLARLARGDIVAALDVYWEEPLPSDHPIRSLPNVILTPHHASTTVNEERLMGAHALRTVLDWADGKSVGAITPERLSRMT